MLGVRGVSMIALREESERYVNLIAGIDPRVVDAIRSCRMSFNHELRTTGGMYYPSGHRIEMNPHASDDHQRNTLGHEIAHALDHRLFQGRGHTYGWAFWMRKLGLPVVECHDYPELMMKHRGAVYVITCYDCKRNAVRTFPASRCQADDCGSEDVLVSRADGIQGQGGKDVQA
jgi:predicted SprT family Zn-dependent metalloprotease